MSVIQPPAFTKLTGAIINGLGDSIIGAQSTYFPATTSFAAIPVWQASTAYVIGNCVTNNGNLYRCTTAGTSAASGGPTGAGFSIADNTVVWSIYNYQSNKGGTSFLSWAEKFSLGRLNFDLSQGYSGPVASMLKVIVTNGGSNYTAPTITFNQGATGTVQISGGKITGITITNPGYGSSAFTASISDASGSGAVLSLVASGSGTFGVTGCLTSDMVARLPDCVAAAVDIFVVHGGANDVAGGTAYATIIANLKTCYETLIASGKKVIAVPITPRTGLSNAKTATLLQVNRWIRAYCRKENWANPSGVTNIALADSTGYYTDGGSLTNQPIGGSGGTSGAMTQDGVHPSVRGAMYTGYAIWLAAQQFVAPAPAYPARAYTMFDGYDAVNNPAGNYLEGFPWIASNAYSVGQLCSNSNNIYRCTQAGTSASSGGPSGTGTSITDSGVKWNYVYPQGMSVLNGTSGTTSAATGITYNGSFASGYTVQRSSGSATGTITGSKESPWSNGQTGQRQVLSFSLGSGTSNEIWWMTAFYSAYATSGILASDLGVNSFYAEAELELSGIANMTQCNIELFDSVTAWNNWDGNNQTGVGEHFLQSSGEMMSLPNSGKIYLRTQPMVLPANLSNLCFNLIFGFDCSGGAGSATASVKINHVAMRKAFVA
jgi:lysophospholipase L1-like esterase